MSPAPRLEGGYATTYDAIYAQKDYATECDRIEEVFRRFGKSGGFRSILDLGCGTGSHSLILAQRGYEVTGVDGSADMVALARRKAADIGASADFVRADMRSVALGRCFDAVIIMFSALGYQTENEEVESVFRNARRHLREGGLLVMDVWYGPTVLSQGPLERIRIVEDDGRQLIRASIPTLHPERNVMDVRVRIWDIAGSRVASRADEVHRVRFFFLPELELLLRSAGFEPAAFFEYPNLDQPPRDETWDLGCIAVAA